MKRIYTYLLAFLVIFSITSIDFVYAIQAEDVIEYEGDFEEDTIELEAVHHSFQTQVTQKSGRYLAEYSEYSDADFTFYHERFIPQMRNKAFVLYQSFLHYN